MASAPVDTVQFAVLMRKGTKQAYREVSVAADSDIARNLQKQEEADRIEKERVKKLTLEMNERQEEEDLHEAIAPVKFKCKNDQWTYTSLILAYFITIFNSNCRLMKFGIWQHLVTYVWKGDLHGFLFKLMHPLIG